MKIEITCKGADTLDIDQLEDFQGALKNLSKKNLKKLKNLVIANGFNAPFFIWDNDGKYKILDGHQRLKAVTSLRDDDGYEVPALPVVYIFADNKKDAREKLLGITSQYGEFELEELGDWLKDLDSDLAKNMRFANEDISLDLDLEESKEDLENDEEQKLKTCPQCGHQW